MYQLAYGKTGFLLLAQNWFPLKSEAQRGEGQCSEDGGRHRSEPRASGQQASTESSTPVSQPEDPNSALAAVAQWTECQPPARHPVRTQAWVSGQVPSRGHTRGNHTLMFLSLSSSLPSPLNTPHPHLPLTCGRGETGDGSNPRSL